MGISRSLLAFSLAGLACFNANLPAAFGGTKSVQETKAAPSHEGIVFDQYYLACLSQTSYLIGDLESKTAVVVDPVRDIDMYLNDAKKYGLKITHVICTHVHADFVAGHIELEKATGAKICFGSKAKAGFKFEPLKEGDKIELGKLTLKVLETPGHTPEAISLLVYDTKSDADKPYAVLTGDCLFIGDVGRPDLMASQGITAAELAGLEYDSLHNKLLTLADDTLVYPAHGAGSLCGKNLSSENVSTIGEQRRSNYALKDMSKEQFVQMITANQPKVYKYFQLERDINLNTHKSLDEVVNAGMKPLKLEYVLTQQKSGAQILDVREMDDFAASHLKDSVNIALSGHYAMWAGNFLDPKKAILIIAPAGKEKEAVLRLGRIGFENVAGYLEGGIEACKDKPNFLESSTRETPEQLSKELASDKPPFVLDIRNDSERSDSYIEGSKQVPLIVLLDELDKLPKDKEIVVQCATGFRSSIAASLLRRHGFAQVSDLAGGITAWKQAKLPLKGVESCQKASN
ncbi:MAG: MBL fold metallo-hydrolase [Candidatus Obscuribacterales bacterium]|nr:MBL fold metallo-hydrolase [Candidatus Obscuribacterales bacterium]